MGSISFCGDDMLEQASGASRLSSRQTIMTDAATGSTTLCRKMQTASRDLRITDISAELRCSHCPGGRDRQRRGHRGDTILAEIELDAIAEDVFVVLDSYQRAGLREPVGSFSRWLHVT
jgi:hypothetical protein